MAIDTENISEKSKKHKKSKSKVSFEEELICKQDATEVLTRIKKSKTQKLKEELQDCVNNDLDIEKEKKRKIKITKGNGNKEKLNKNKRKSDYLEDVSNEKNLKNKKQVIRTEEDNEIGNQKEKKRKKNKITEENGSVEETDKNKMKEDREGMTTEEVDEEISKQNQGVFNSLEKTEESVRARKRRKQQELLEEKKKKTQQVTQENVLNYLSKWKHARDQWKFEKLKQIWLSEHLFNSSSIPDEFWDTTVDYFSGSKGFIRNLILREALKIVEQEDKTEDKNLDEDYQNKLKRARDIVQNLQE